MARSRLPDKLLRSPNAWIAAVPIAAILLAIAYVFADYALAVRQMQNRSEQTAYWRARQLLEIGTAAGAPEQPLQYSRSVEALPPGEIHRSDRGGVRVVIRSSYIVPILHRAHVFETSSIAVILPQDGGGSRVAVMR